MTVGAQCGFFADTHGYIDIFFTGGTWKPLIPPKVDSQGRGYECNGVVSKIIHVACWYRGLIPDRNAPFMFMVTPSDLILERRIVVPASSDSSWQSETWASH